MQVLPPRNNAGPLTEVVHMRNCHPGTARQDEVFRDSAGVQDNISPFPHDSTAGSSGTWNCYKTVLPGDTSPRGIFPYDKGNGTLEISCSPFLLGQGISPSCWWTTGDALFPGTWPV